MRESGLPGLAGLPVCLDLGRVDRFDSLTGKRLPYGSGATHHLELESATWFPMGRVHLGLST